MTEIHFRRVKLTKTCNGGIHQSIFIYLLMVKTYSGIQKRVNLFTSIPVTSQLQVKIYIVIT